MTDIVVSVRMPSSLVRELRSLAETNHFKDLSEEVRSVIRAKCLHYAEPYSSELKKLREELSEQFAIKKDLEHKKKLMDDLKNILEQMKDAS
jgi:Arc/MetJ-type ribon-helix-helix transcriptional regulator